MFGRALARVVTALALVAASVAWAGWVYLHTVADPSRSDRIAHAILDDRSARHQLAADISDSIAAAADKALSARGAPATVDGADPTLLQAVDQALSDPRIAANIVDAIASEHAQVLGARPTHPAVIDTALLLDAVRADLAPGDAQLARALPAVAPRQVRLPVVKIPFARQARSWAQRWVHILALSALAGLLLALLIGDRVVVARRWGAWAIGAGASWAVIPPLVVWAGDHWARSQAAVIRAVVRGATGGVTAVAVILAIGGAGAVAASYLSARLFGGRRIAPVTGPPSPAWVPGRAAHPGQAAPRAPGDEALLGEVWASPGPTPPGGVMRTPPTGVPPVTSAPPAKSPTDAGAAAPAPWAVEGEPALAGDQPAPRPARRPGVSRSAIVLHTEPSSGDADASA